MEDENKKPKDIFEKLNIKPLVPTVIDNTPSPPAVINDPDHDSFEADFEEARRNMVYIMEVAKNALEDVHVIAKEKEGAKEFEALNNLLRTVGDASGNLLKLHQARKKFKEVPAKSKNENNGVAVNGNAVFVGSSSDLRKLLDKKD